MTKVKYDTLKDWVETELGQPITDSVELLEEMVKQEKLDWANGLIARLLNRQNRIRYAVYAAESVLDIYEKKYPDDKRPRIAIEAAKAVIENDTKENRNAAFAAAYAAYAAAYAAGDAAAAYAAAHAAHAAGDAAADAAAAHAAAYAAAHAAAHASTLVRIVEYGLKLHKEEQRK